MVRKSTLLKTYSKPFFYILSALLTSLIFPLIISLQIRLLIANDIEFAAYLMKVDLILLPLLFTGIIITILTGFLFFYEPYMYGRLVFSVLPEAIYIIQIFIISSLLDVYLNVSSTFIRIDISRLYLFIIGIPALIILKNTYNFSTTRKESRLRYHILKILYTLKGESSKKKLQKAFANDTTLNREVKMVIRKNLSNFITDMEQIKHPIVELREGKYQITKKGYKIISYFDNWFDRKAQKLEDSENINIEDLEYWSEDDFS
jgi:hypothetical protein